jgi:hypothetical protein
MHYKIIWSTTMIGLEVKVNRDIASGTWIPIGGVAVGFNGGTFLQAMISTGMAK